MAEKENNSLKEWEVAICPIRSKQCLRGQCAWWLKEDKECAVAKIASPEIKKTG